MKRLLLSAFPLILFVLPFSVHSQTHTPRYVSMITNSGGYYEYLPQGYNSNSNQTYPVIIFVHGFGQLGSGTQQDLPLVLLYGLPQVIDEGRFPRSFSVNNQTYRPIIISPQFKSWPNAVDIQGVIAYVTQNYKVDANRIYLTGMSMGGGTTWNYAVSSVAAAGKIAAIVPVCGAATPTRAGGNTIATAKLPVLATHNDGDQTVPVSNTDLFIDYINSPNPPMPAAKKVIFNSDTHDAWTQTYDPNWTVDGTRNIYQWMLQYTRGTEIPLPVKLAEYTAAPDNAGRVRVAWKTVYEHNNSYFSIERSTDGSSFTLLSRINASNIESGSLYEFLDQSPINGISYYRLSQTDLDGRTELLGTRQVSVSNTGNLGMKLFPNPVQSNLSVRINDGYLGRLQIRVISTSGHVLTTLDLKKETNFLQQDIPLHSLPKGNYVLEVKGDNSSYSNIFIKQ